VSERWVRAEARRDTKSRERAMSDSRMSFEQYWVLFVRAHVNPLARRTRFAATSASVACAAAGVLSRRGSLLVLAAALAWVPNWVARQMLEGAVVGVPANVPYAVLASLKLCEMSLLGTFDAEIQRVLAIDEQKPMNAPGGDPTVPPPNMVTDHTLH